MKLVIKGLFNGDENSLPHGEIYPGSEKMDPDETTDAIMNRLNIIALVIDALVFVVFCLISGIKEYDMLAFVLTLVIYIAHEFLHAICFKNEVYLYFWKEKGSAFVIGNEPMSKPHFILMSLLPNIVFGFIPFILYLIHPTLTLLGSLSVLTIGMGIGDYYNVISALRRVPNNAKVYLHKFTTYWYIPKQ